MNSSSWEKSRNKQRPLWVIIVIAVIALIIVAVFLQNNSELFWGISPQKEKMQEEESLSLDESESLNMSHDSIREEIASKIADPEPNKVPEEKSADKVIPLNNIECKVADRPDLTVAISLELIYDKTKSKKEILFKREDLKVMVYNALSKKNLSDILVEKIRPEILKEVNRVLKKGKITDVIFTDFRIEKAPD